MVRLKLVSVRNTRTNRYRYQYIGIGRTLSILYRSTGSIIANNALLMIVFSVNFNEMSKLNGMTISCLSYLFQTHLKFQYFQILNDRDNAQHPNKKTLR